MIYAKIDPTQNPNIVMNTQIMAATDYMDPAFTWIDVTNVTPRPYPGCIYISSNFSEPSNVITAPFDNTLLYLHTGILPSFVAFDISEGPYTVSINNNLDVLIGCQTYNGLWLRYALYSIITLGNPSVGSILTLNSDKSITQTINNTSFTLSSISTNLILTALETINFFPI